MRSALGKRQTRSRNKIRDNSRYQNFIGKRLGHHAGSCMHSDAADIPSPDFDFASVKAGADGEAYLADRRGECQRAAHRPRRAIEGRQDPSPVDLTRVPRCFSTICDASSS